MTIYQKLVQIQTEMKAPKNKYNEFGKYSYRNAESILEAFKPFAAQYNVTLLLSDSIQQSGDRYYIKAEAKFIDLESDQMISVSAFAREAENQKGMDAAQITGCASSYARKYALNGLFLIDDTKDPDEMEFRNEKQNRQQARRQEQQNQATQIIDAEDAEALERDLRMADVNIAGLLSQTRFNVKDVHDLTVEQAKTIRRELENHRNNKVNRGHPVAVTA